MRIDFILVVLAEWIAFIAWLSNYKKITTGKHRLFVGYLGVIAVTELANLIFRQSDKSITNIIVMHFNVPLQFVFWFYFLLRSSKEQVIFWSFIAMYFLFFIAERCNVFISPIYFDSLSYSIGNLLLIIAIIISMFQFFKTADIIHYNKTAFFWIVVGITIYYIGSFPYQNFRNYFWSNPSYYSTADFLHYLSQTLNCIMYLLFAYATKWKIK